MQAGGAKFYLPEPTFEKEKAKGGSTLIIIVLERQRQIPVVLWSASITHSACYRPVKDPVSKN